MKIERILNKTKFEIKKHTPEILIVTGVVGIVTSTIMACKATTKLEGILNKCKNDIKTINDVIEHPENLPAGENYTKQDAKKDLAIVYARTGLELIKLYAPSVIIGALSIGCVVSSNDILKRRNAALAAAYTTIDKSYRNYRKNVVERFGEDLDKELKYNIKAQEIEKTVIDENGNEKKVKETINVSNLSNEYSQYAKIYDDGCNGWEKDAEHNLWFLLQQQNFANEKLRSQGYLFLNDVYESLGIPKTKAGQIVGWVYDEKNPKYDGFVDFGIYNTNITKNRDFINGYEKAIILDFNVDGNILDIFQNDDKLFRKQLERGK